MQLYNDLPFLSRLIIAKTKDVKIQNERRKHPRPEPQNERRKLNPAHT